MAFGIDGGLRFARHWYVGLTLDHALLNTAVRATCRTTWVDVTGASSNTTQLGIILALIGNPDRVSFYGEVGLADRWFNVRETRDGRAGSSRTYTGGEFTLGIGVWIPVGRAVPPAPENHPGPGLAR